MGKLKLTTIPRTREEWLLTRNDGIGGSEVGAVMGVNPYQCALEVFYKKVGLLPEEFKEGNFKTFMGQVLEPQIADLWKYWDGSEESISENYAKKTPIRNCVEFKYRVQNEDFPYLIGHTDRIICKRMEDVYNPSNGILEIKNINYYAIKQWEDGIPPYQLYQVQTYLAITGLKYAELVMLKDGNSFLVHQIARDETLINEIIIKIGAFWETVQIGRHIMADNSLSEDEKYNLIDQVQPTPDSNPSWETFLKQYYKSNPDLPVLKGDDDLLVSAFNYNDASNRIKNIEDEKQYWKNVIIQKLGSHEIAEFEGNGKITLKQDKRGTRTLRIGLKHFEFAS